VATHIREHSAAMLRRPPFDRWSRYASQYRQAWRDDNVTGLAAEVAFFSVLSIFPGL